MFELPGKIALAPMAGVTDRAFREICMEFGADCCTTEMVSAKAVEQGNKKTDEYARLLPGRSISIWAARRRKSRRAAEART